MLMAQFICCHSKKWYHRFTKKFEKIEKALKEYDNNALLPQLNTAVELAVASQIGSKLSAKANVCEGDVSAESSESFKENTELILFHINESEKSLKVGLSDIKLDNDFILFLDGLDARPSDIQKTEFQQCLQGLYDGLWQLNTEFFPKIRDSKGRMRLCLLIRPDIFESLNAYNSTSRVSDNSVFLNWQTTESDYEKQPLFKTVNKYFISQNNDTYSGWNEYFPYKNEKGHNDFFVDLLKKTFMRPRDYFSALKILIQEYKDNNREDEKIKKTDIESDWFRRNLADYMLGEIKNYMNFYISNKDYAEYMKFFQYLNGKVKFSWAEYCSTFEMFKKYMDENDVENRDFYKTPLILLQFFYDSNLIGYTQKTSDSKSFVFWAYREKTLNNLCPKVKESADYIVFEGVRKALDIGKSFSRKRR